MSAIKFLDSFRIKIIAVITDNARNMINAMELVFSERNSNIPLRCSSHTLNLIIKDALEDVEFLKMAHIILLEYIKNGEINQYSETR